MEFFKLAVASEAQLVLASSSLSSLAVGSKYSIRQGKAATPAEFQYLPCLTRRRRSSLALSTAWCPSSPFNTSSARCTSVCPDNRNLDGVAQRSNISKGGGPVAHY